MLSTPFLRFGRPKALACWLPEGMSRVAAEFEFDTIPSKERDAKAELDQR